MPVASRRRDARASPTGAHQTGLVYQSGDALASMPIHTSRVSWQMVRTRLAALRPQRRAPTANAFATRGAGLGYAKHARHRRDREDDLVRAHEFEDSDGIALVSRANQAAARERMSRSRRSCLFSRRNRRFIRCR